MSRSTLEVRFPDGTIRYGVYDGTSDVALKRLYSYQPDLRQEDLYDEINDSDEEVFPVDIWASYGGGMLWTGMATRLSIKKGRDPFDHSHEETNYAEWVQFLEDMIPGKEDPEPKPSLDYIKGQFHCFQCKKSVDKVLRLEKTRADLCSLECERAYWLEILY